MPKITFGMRWVLVAFFVPYRAGGIVLRRYLYTVLLPRSKALDSYGFLRGGARPAPLIRSWMGEEDELHFGVFCRWTRRRHSGIRARLGRDAQAQEPRSRGRSRQSKSWSDIPRLFASLAAIPILRALVIRLDLTYLVMTFLFSLSAPGTCRG